MKNRQMRKAAFAAFLTAAALMLTGCSAEDVSYAITEFTTYVTKDSGEKPAADSDIAPAGSVSQAESSSAAVPDSQPAQLLPAAAATDPASVTEIPVQEEQVTTASDLGDPIEPAGSLSGFAYDQLDESVRDIYAQLYAGISQRKSEFTIRAKDTEDIKPALSAIMTDCPQFFWIDGNANMSGFRSLGIWRITLNFTVEPDQIDGIESRIEQKVQEYLSMIPEGADDYEKVRLAYKYIIDTTDYDLESEDNQNIQSVFLNGISVCAGYSRAFKYLMDRVGIWCGYVEGTIADTGEGHAWNVVRLGDVYTYVDPSWGDPTYGEDDTDARRLDIIYDYLCLTTDEMNRVRHVPDGVWELPECTDRTYDYYIRNGMYQEGYDEDSISRVLWNAVDNAEDVVYYKFSDEDSYLRAKEALFPEGEDRESLLNAPIRQRMEWDEVSSLRYYYSCSDELWIIKIYW